MATEVPNAVFEFFACDPAGPMLTFAREAAEPRDALREPIEAFLSSFRADDVAAAQASPDFQFFQGHQPDKDKAARVWLGQWRLASEIASHRLEAIRRDVGNARPKPYALPQLQDLDVGDDHLVPLSAFEFDGARLMRNDFAFLVLPTTGSPNSTYWLLAAIFEQGLASRTRVRLDPFLYGPADTFPAMHYRMWLYGRLLDWARLAALQEPEHGRWMTGSPRSHSQFTDYAWTPRDSEVHFVCEEIPGAENVSTDGARYLHAVYSRRTAAIEHFDGAIRIYSPPEIEQRRAVHARNAGKLGLREKVFIVDGSTYPDALSQVAQAFFVWNDDVQKYFRDAVPFDSTT